jgi:hypothetical protein
MIYKAYLKQPGDVAQIYKTISEEERAIKQKLKDDLERKEFERLKEKFGNK